MMCHAEFLLAASNDYAAQESIVEVAARMVDRIVRRNDASRGLLSNQDAPNASSLFESSKKCPLSPPAYLRRILKYTACSTSTIPVGLVYLQRLRNALADTGAVAKLMVTAGRAAQRDPSEAARGKLAAVARVCSDMLERGIPNTGASV